MTGSAFIIHNDTWSCSNEVTLGIYTDIIINSDNKFSGYKESQSLTVNGIFNFTKPLSEGDKCEFVLLSDDHKDGENKKYSFFAQAKAVGEKQVILNIFSKSSRISEILSNITFKK